METNHRENDPQTPKAKLSLARRVAAGLLGAEARPHQIIESPNLSEVSLGRRGLASALGVTYAKAPTIEQSLPLEVTPAGEDNLGQTEALPVGQQPVAPVEAPQAPVELSREQ